MNIEFVEKWVAAMRSGKYKQSSNALRDQAGFCCLGVACDLYDDSKWEWGKAGRYFNYGGGEGAPVDFPPDYVNALLNNGGPLIVRIGSGAFHLSRLNDSMGWTFAQIADAIEADWINGEPLEKMPTNP